MLADQMTIDRKEVALAVVGEKALGTFGLWRRASEIPARLGRERRGLRAEAVLWIATLGAAFSPLPGITEIVSFGSLTFLLVFGLINLLRARHTAAPGPDRGLANAAAACIAAAGGLLYIWPAPTARPRPNRRLCSSHHRGPSAFVKSRVRRRLDDCI